MSGPFDADAHADHMATVAGLDIRPEWRADVIATLAATAAIAAPLLAFPLEDHVEPGPVFEP